MTLCTTCTKANRTCPVYPMETETCVEYQGGNMRRIVAIDPGIGGSVAVLAPDGELLAQIPMPTMKVGKANRVNAAALAHWIRQHMPDHAFIEQVGAMPGQGVASMFNFGHSAGVVAGVVAGLLIPITYVTPKAWKKSTGLIGQDKDAARARAIQLYPHVRALDLKGKGQALADAILIGRHGLGLEGAA